MAGVSVAAALPRSLRAQQSASAATERACPVNNSRAEHRSGRPQFSLFALLTSVMVVAILFGWWADRRGLKTEFVRLHAKLKRQTQAARFGKLKLLEDLRRPNVVGSDIADFPQVPAFADDISDDSMAPLLWDRAAADRKGKQCVGYYFQTADVEEGHPGYYVLTVNGKIVAVDLQVVVW